MAKDTKLTSVQLEILEVVWSKGKEGATVAEIWEELQKGRELARTTVLTLVQRLERRGWLVAETSARAHRFRATRPREHARRRVLKDLVDGLFGGSPSALVASLLGSRKIERKEVEHLKALLDAKAKEVP
jgi:predicted transcriptional regulator